MVRAKHDASRIERFLQDALSLLGPGAIRVDLPERDLDLGHLRRIGTERRFGDVERLLQQRQRFVELPESSSEAGNSVQGLDQQIGVGRREASHDPERLLIRRLRVRVTSQLVVEVADALALSATSG